MIVTQAVVSCPALANLGVVFRRTFRLTTFPGHVGVGRLDRGTADLADVRSNHIREPDATVALYPFLSLVQAGKNGRSTLHTSSGGGDTLDLAPAEVYVRVIRDTGIVIM